MNDVNDRTGQVWELIRAIALVVGPPRTSVQTDEAGTTYDQLLHPCVLLTAPMLKVSDLTERSSNPWDARASLRRIV